MIGNSPATLGADERGMTRAAHASSSHPSDGLDAKLSAVDEAALAQLVTVFVGGQMFGLPILQVRDVFLVSGLTPVPLAPASVAGLHNLRGRVMTMLSMRALLGFERSDAAGTETTAIGIEWRGESFGLLVDKVGEVMAVAVGDRDRVPIHLARRWAALSAGVHRLDERLLIELSLDSLFQDSTFQIGAGGDDAVPTKPPQAA